MGIHKSAGVLPREGKLIVEVAVSGASGLIGTALTSALKAAGHRPVALVRRPTRTGDEIQWSPSDRTIDAESLKGISAVVHLAGAPIGKRWTDSYKKVLFESRVNGTELLASTLAQMDGGPTRFLSGSAIGFYGDGTQAVNETSARGSGFLADLTVAWEEAAQVAVDADNVSVAFLRTGIVQSRKGGALGKQLPLFKLGAGGRLGSGNQFTSWISMTDQVAAIIFLLAHPDGQRITGPVNLTAPNPVTNAEYTKALGAAVNRPTFIPVPMFGPKLLFGAELVKEMLEGGQMVIPQVLLDAGFTFAHDTIEEALVAELSRKREVA